MKTKMTKLNRKQQAALGALLALGLTATGCTHSAARRARVGAELTEESRALTTAVVDALQSQPVTNRDIYTATALTFAKQDQRVEGLPIKPFDVPTLLLGATNTPAFHEATDNVAQRFARQEELIQQRADTEARLIDKGIDAEAARNRRISRWTRLGLWGTTLIGGAIGLFVLCPVALPICGRILAWLVGKVPSLASAFGVVSVKAFDAVVRAVEKTKSAAQTQTTASTVPVANSATFTSGDSRRGQESWIDQLHTNLSREMDAAHKALVRSRKIQLA